MHTTSWSAPPGDVRMELIRGATFGRTLSGPLRETLDRLVRSGRVHEEDFLEAETPSAPLRSHRSRRRVDRLVAMRFLRRDDGYLLPSVTGIGAVRPRATPRGVHLYFQRVGRSRP